jgi:YebC/PmpR family DNA-binding regulatory protein
MSGHSKWHTIKHKKGALDAKRGKTFTRIIKELTVAARHGGGDPDTNPRLRTVIADAKAVNMPSDNIKKAIQRGTGELPGVNYEEIVYEGYGPGGVAILVETATDNRNRTAADVRSLFSKSGGQLAGAGSVAWQFEPRGLVSVPGNGQDPDEVALLAIDAGAVDVDTDSDPVEITTSPADLQVVREALEAAGVKVDSAEMTMQAKSPIEIDAAQARQNLRLIEALEDHDDVQRVTANFELPDEILAEAAAS